MRVCVRRSGARPASSTSWCSAYRRTSSSSTPPQILTAWMGIAFAAKASACLRLSVRRGARERPGLAGLSAPPRRRPCRPATAHYHLFELLIHVPLSIVLHLPGGRGRRGPRVVAARSCSTRGPPPRGSAQVAGLSVWSLARESLGRGPSPRWGLLPIAVAGRIWFSASGRVETVALLAVLGLVYVLPAAWLGLSPADRSARVRRRQVGLFRAHGPRRPVLELGGGPE